MSNTQEHYNNLHKALNKFELKVPKSKKFTELLQLLYTPEEAEVISHFGKPYSHFEKIETTSEKTGKPLSEIKELFNNMVERGTLFYLKNDNNEILYSLPPFIPGFYEYYTMSRNDSFTKKKEVLKILDDYFFETFVPEAFDSSTYPYFRVLPADEPVQQVIEIEKKLTPETKILPFEIASEYIKSAEYIAVGDCACRDHAEMQDGKKRCDKPVDVCLVFDRVAEYWADKGIGRLIGYEEAMEVLQRSAEAGLVHCTTNNQVFGKKMSGMICNCCPCCCFILQGLLKIRGEQNGLAKSNFQPAVNHDDCNLCQKCVDVCPVDALYHHKPHLDDFSDNFVALNEHTCIGCGLCVMACKQDSIHLEKVREDIPELTILHSAEKHTNVKKH